MASWAILHRPIRFDEIIGQELPVEILSKIADRTRAGNEISHRAFLVSGAYGSGKTTLARVFACALNCESPVPDGDCHICLPIRAGRQAGCYIEVDGATFGTIDQMRQLNQAVGYAPPVGRYLVVVIDESHQLSPEAFNASLKLIEDPPPYAVFMFLTTRRDRIPDTIQSRCLDLRLVKVEPQKIAGRLVGIAHLHHISLHPHHAHLIVEIAGGIVRDSIILLEQLSILGGGVVTKELLESKLPLLKLPVRDLVLAVYNGDVKHIHELAASIAETQIDFPLVVKKIAEFVRLYWCASKGLMPPLLEFDALELDPLWCLQFLGQLIKLAGRIGRDGALASEDFRLTMYALTERRRLNGHTR